MKPDKYDVLKLDNQLCFPLYAAAKEVTRRYQPLLDPLDLTYTQYITMMVMWEQKTLTVKKLGERLFLDSGTLTPVLKKLEQKGFIVRRRDSSDERQLEVSVTDEGLALRDRALSVPQRMACSVTITREEAETLCRILAKMFGKAEES